MLQDDYEKKKKIHRDVEGLSEEQINPQLHKALFVLFERQRDRLYVLENFIYMFEELCRELHMDSKDNKYWVVFDLCRKHHTQHAHP
jgi:hypothetical protein